MSESSESETVGYKQPPRKTQFKPGKSGNPRGRPKRKVNMSESLNRVLDDKIVVTGLGKGKTGLEAFVQSVVDRVLQGDSKGTRQQPVEVSCLNQSGAAGKVSSLSRPRRRGEAQA